MRKEAPDETALVWLNTYPGSVDSPVTDWRYLQVPQGIKW